MQDPDYPMPGQLVSVDGVGMHFHSIGEGAPAIILEAAIGDFSLTWSLVQEPVSQFTRAIAYDRAGLGWSESSSRLRTGEAMVDELKRLLDVAGVARPVILVGHSFSGLLVRLFAYRYPQEVVGLVLLDPAHEDQFTRFPQPIREMFAPLREGQITMLQQNAEILRSQGADKATPLVMPPPVFSEEVAAAYAAQSIADPSRVETMIEELRHLERTQEQVRAHRPNGLGELPVTVISHGIAQEVPGMPAEVNLAYEAAWQEMQREMAGMSSRGKQVIARESGHMIHHQQAELVIEEIERMVDLSKG